MAESVIQMSKQANKIDGFMKQKAYTFLEKLAEDDTVPGLHVEPIKGSTDPRVRTGRVDEQYRAVMFKVMNEHTCVYVIHGIYNHDEANRLAEKLTMTVNPINGLPDFNQSAPNTTPASQSWEAQSSPVASAPQPLIAFSAEDLTTGLGIPPETAAKALTYTSEFAFSEWAEMLPQWQGLALSCLASGEPITTVAQELELLNAPINSLEAEVAFEEQGPASDQAIIDGFDRSAAKMEFARIDGADELRRVILDGDFGAWRVFLHPQQRKWAEKSWNGAFRLAGGAGTGKTVVAIHRARRLALDDPAACVVLTTFTTNLAQELVSSLKKLVPDVPLVGEMGRPGSTSRASTPSPTACSREPRTVWRKRCPTSSVWVVETSASAHPPTTRGTPQSIPLVRAWTRSCAKRHSSRPSTKWWCCPTMSSNWMTTSPSGGPAAG